MCRWIRFLTTSRPDIEVVLSEPYAGPSRADGDALAALPARGEPCALYFRAAVPAVRGPVGDPVPVEQAESAS